MKIKMNYKIPTMIVVFMALTLLSLNGFSKNDQPTITKTFNLDQPGQLDASSSGGGIVVQTHDNPEVIIQAFVRRNGRLLSPTDKDLDEVMDAFDLDFSKSGSVITAKVKQKIRLNFWRNNVGISLTIIVPREMSCNVSSSGGSLKIYDVEGTHSFSSSGGGVQLENVTGTTEAGSSGGGVKVINHNGNIRLNSSGGGVTVTDAHGSVYAHSSGGGVHLTNIDGDVDASSSGGGVSVTGATASVKAKSSGGSVRVDVRDLIKELSLESSGGGVDAVIHNGRNLGLDLDLRSGKVNIELQNFSGESEEDRVKGTMNNGGIPVYMRASGGNVNVKFE